MRNQLMNMSRLLVKGILTSALVFSVGVGSAFADSASSSPTPAVTTNTVVTASLAPASTPTAGSHTNLSPNTELQKPGLLPGDFFYFIKSTYESIRLAIAVGDVKEARLLAEFAQERLAEAQALLADGKTALASRTLQNALNDQQASLTKLDHATGSTTAQATASASPAAVTATPAPSAAATVSPSTSPTVSTADDDEDNKKVEGVKNQEKVLKVKADLQHNIIALTAALEKVKNPKAQMALLKNIEKSFTHLEKKLSKVEDQTAAEQPALTATAAAATATSAPMATSTQTTTPIQTSTQTQTATPILTIAAMANTEDNDDAGEVQEKEHKNIHEGQKSDRDRQKEKHENNGKGKGHDK